MVTFANRAKVSTSTTGTGTITLGTAVDGYQTFTDAGVVNSDVVRYTIEDGDAWEIGSGTYSAGTLTRVLDESSTGSLLNLSGDAVVYVTAAGEDIVQPSDLATVATTGAYSDLSGLPTLGTAAAADTGDFATAAQGSLADSAVQPADNISTLTNDAGYITSADGGNADLLDGQHGAYYLDYTNFLNTPTIYTDAAVDTHLNTGTAASGEVLSWNGSDYDWVAVSGGATDIDGLSDGYSDGSSVGLGSGALANDDGTANNNTAVGVGAGSIITSGNTNVLIGRSANLRSAGGTEAVVVGPYAKAGNSSVAIGSTAGGSIGTSSDQNVFVGAYSGRYTNNSHSIGLGIRSLNGNFASLMTGDFNIGIGYETGYDLTTGARNFLGGYQAGTNLTTGSNNVALGNGALDAATTGGRNIAIGQDAMGLGVATTASGDNVAIGYRAGYDLTSGIDNVLIGDSAGANITTGWANVAIGKESLLSYNGDRSVAIGEGAARNWTGGQTNVVIGGLAGGIGANSTGANNTIIGDVAGYSIANGSDNVFVGAAAGDATTTGSNQIVIGKSADASSATVSNEITLGNTSINRFRIPGAGIDNTSAALSGTTPSVDVGARDTYTLTTSGNTTFTFTGAPSSGQVGTFSLIITAGGTHTLTWPASVDWAGGTAPDAPASGEKDIYTFMTVDGGTTWYGFLAGDAMA